MGNLWLKIKVWTKVTLFCLVLAYVLLFVAKNSSAQVTTWYWINKEAKTSTLLLMLYVFFAGVVMTILVRTTFVTIAQIRELRHKTRTTRLERDMADMRAKAGMLRTRDMATKLPDGSTSPEEFLADEG